MIRLNSRRSSTDQCIISVSPFCPVVPVQYKLVNAIRNGWIRLDDEEEEEKDKTPPVYLMWAEDGKAAGDRSKFAPPPITAPKPKLPGHAESYNPSPEYLPTEEELNKWEDLEPEDRYAPPSPTS
jgi:ribosome biogenesis protein ERB1